MDQSPPTSSDTPPPQDHVRLRVQKACKRCRGLKLKCSAEQPCKRCKQANVECVYLASKPRAKPVFIKPKFTNLKEKEAKLDATFDKVNDLVKKLSKLNNNEIEFKENLAIIENHLKFLSMNFESGESFYIAPKIKQQIPHTQCLSPPDDLENCLVISSLNIGTSQFCKDLIQSFISNLLYSFPLVMPINTNTLLSRNVKNSALLNAILAITLRIFYFQKGMDPTSHNPFYLAAKFILNDQSQTPNIEHAQAHALCGMVEMSRGWVLQSTSSTNKATRIAQALGLDKICYDCKANFDSKKLEGCLIWMNCLTFDCFHSAELDLPPLIHKSTIQISTELPDFDLYPKFCEDMDFRVFLQSQIFYSVANFVNQVKVLSREFNARSKLKGGIESLKEELSQLYLQCQDFQMSGWFMPIDFQIDESVFHDRQELFSFILRSLMFRFGYIKVCQMFQQFYYIYPFSKSPLLAPDVTISQLYELQDTCQRVAINTIQLYSKMKYSSHPHWNHTLQLMYSMTPSLAFTMSVLSQHFLHDLSPFGKSCYDFCYGELKFLSTLWPGLKHWVNELQKPSHVYKIPDLFQFGNPPDEFDHSK